MINEIYLKDNTENKKISPRKQKKITPQRLKNIALYYLKRFESSVENLRKVLQRRVTIYAKENPEFNKHEAFEWIEQILQDFVRLKYLDDQRYAEIKIQSYLNAGKPARYIKPKLRQKGISEELIDEILQNEEYDAFSMALKLAKKKRIGPYRATEENRRDFKQKDMGTLVRAGFDYDIVIQVLNYNLQDEEF